MDGLRPTSTADNQIATPAMYNPAIRPPANNDCKNVRRLIINGALGMIDFVF